MDIHHKIYGCHIYETLKRLPPDAFMHAIDLLAGIWRLSDEKCLLSEYIQNSDIMCQVIPDFSTFMKSIYHDPEVTASIISDKELLDYWLEEHNMSEVELLEIHDAAHHIHGNKSTFCYVPGRY